MVLKIMAANVRRYRQIARTNCSRWRTKNRSVPSRWDHIAASYSSKAARIESRNVLGRVDGDASLQALHLPRTWDHLGVGVPIARRQDHKTARSITTWVRGGLEMIEFGAALRQKTDNAEHHITVRKAEEAGLLALDYYGEHPVVLPARPPPI